MQNVRIKICVAAAAAEAVATPVAADDSAVKNYLCICMTLYTNTIVNRVTNVFMQNLIPIFWKQYQINILSQKCE